MRHTEEDFTILCKRVILYYVIHHSQLPSKQEIILKGINTLTREAILSKLVLLPLSIRGLSRGKNLMPGKKRIHSPGSKFLPLRVNPIQKETRKANSCHPIKMAKKLPIPCKITTQISIYDNIHESTQKTTFWGPMTTISAFKCWKMNVSEPSQYP